MPEELLALLEHVPIPTFQQFVFIQVALFTAVMALLVVISKNLFHSALALVGTLFGVAGVYAIQEAEFLAVSQVLVYVGGISTLITFAIMLTRGMMFGKTSQLNRQSGSVAMIVGTFFLVLLGVLINVPWPEAGLELAGGEEMIAQIGMLFVTTYLVPFEMMAVLLLVALAGAILLARDRK